jgi:spermidine synthase
MDRLWRLDQVLWEGDTEYQHVVIARTRQGVSLFCDGERQSTEFSQLVYHEALLVPALLLAERVDSVLIVGSSEGVASQLALAAGARRVDHVDIDEQCVRECAHHLPYGYSSDELEQAERGGSAVRVHYADGWAFVAQAASAGRRYDVVVVDLPDERTDDDGAAAQHNRLYEEEFLRMCRSVLADGGVLATQAGCPTLWRNDTLARSWQRFAAEFPTVVYFGSDEHEWSFLFGRTDTVADPTTRMIEALPRCRYQPETLDAMTLVGSTVPPHAIRADLL